MSDGGSRCKTKPGRLTTAATTTTISGYLHQYRCSSSPVRYDFGISRFYQNDQVRSRKRENVSIPNAAVDIKQASARPPVFGREPKSPALINLTQKGGIQMRDIWLIVWYAAC